LRTADYTGPEREADIVMKGGITSGVVYPHTVCELARTFRFRSVGGTSAGAIAAAAAAAAEYGRADEGFNRLAGLPDWIGGDNNLLNLFQPQRQTAKLFRLMVASLNKRSRLILIALAALRGFGLGFLAGSAPGIGLALIIGFEASGWPRWLGVVLACLLALIGGILATVVAIVISAGRQLPKNLLGLCTGMPGKGPPGAPALTPWLTQALSDFAGTDALLTFGDLRAQGIELAMVTTNLTNRKPHRLPWSERGFYFDPREWRRLFPVDVVLWLENHPPPPPANEDEQREWEAALEQLSPLRPLPAPDDLPVVVAARLSLSFPLLISAVPLWAIDETRTVNQRATAAIRADLPPTDDNYARLEPERCWFSDGGISSNFPIHFFDSPLPTRPTFAIDLSGFHRDHPEQPDESQNVWLPQRNSSGLLSAWYRFGEQGGLNALVGFVSAIARTMQNRIDSALMRQPGYRDRIAHVHLDDREGGMNLSMDRNVLTRLTGRGQEAGRLLTGRFGPVHDPSDPLTWDNHRWVRYRTLMSALVELLERFRLAWLSQIPGERGYPELNSRASDQPPPSYRWANLQDEATALAASEALAAVAEMLAGDPESLSGNTPRPRAQERIVPRD
jgi:predicted acylesterase/phospholipase RssA